MSDKCEGYIDVISQVADDLERVSSEGETYSDVVRELVSKVEKAVERRGKGYGGFFKKVMAVNVLDVAKSYLLYETIEECVGEERNRERISECFARAEILEEILKESSLKTIMFALVFTNPIRGLFADLERKRDELNTCPQVREFFERLRLASILRDVLGGLK